MERGDEPIDIDEEYGEEGDEELVQEKQMVLSEEEKAFEEIKASLTPKLGMYIDRFLKSFEDFQEGMLERISTALEREDEVGANRIIQILRSRQSHINMIDTFVDD